MNSRAREQTEDLKAFEQRLTECVQYVETTTSKWRIIIVFVLLWLLVSIIKWWKDETKYSGYLEMFKSHQSLSLCLTTIAILYFCGVFERSKATTVLTHRCRNILKYYNMSCDEKGKLILKKTPRQHIDSWRDNQLL